MQLRTLALVVVPALWSLGCATASLPTHRPEDVLAADTGRARAMVEASAPRLREALHADLTYTHSNGVVESRAALIEGLGSGRLDYRKIESLEPTVRIRGASAIVTGPVHVVVAAGGQQHDLRGVYTAVYWYDDGRWQLVAYQSSPR